LIEHGGKTRKITISMGIALCPNHGKSMDNALKAADTALYQAKEAGRDRVCVAKTNENE